MKLRTRQDIQGESQLRAVVYSQANDRVEIHADINIEGDQLEFDARKLVRDFPTGAHLAIVPQEVQSPMRLRRLLGASHVPMTTLTQEMMEHPLQVRDRLIESLGDLTHTILPLRRWVSGRVVKRDPTTGALSGVPGAKVRVMDVDFHFFWWHPWPLLRWAWIYPLRPRYEEIGTAITDQAGYFGLNIPLFDIDYALTWRLRFRCMPETLLPPNIGDVLDAGIRPDIRSYPQFEHFFLPPPHASLATPDVPITRNGSPALPIAPRLSRTPERIFERIDGETELLQQPAFPDSLPAPALPPDEELLEYLQDQELLEEMRTVKPLVRLVHCAGAFVPTFQRFVDVPDVVFWVDQDTNGDGTLEAIYRNRFFDINWNLSEPTTRVLLEAWPNALTLPSDATADSYPVPVIAGLNDYPTSLLSPEGYATTVNRPKPAFRRPVAQTPFCGTTRLVGSPEMENASYYRVFYTYGTMPESHFMERWTLWEVGTTHFLNITPDPEGFYPVLRPAGNYFPYNTLINWNTGNYPNGHYTIHMEVYDAAKVLLTAPPEIHVQVDNSAPIIEFVGLKYRIGTGEWQSVASLDCVLIHRQEGENLDLEMTYQVAAEHLRDFDISFVQCGAHAAPITENHWHTSVTDNNTGNIAFTTSLPYVPNTDGAYYWSITARSRAFTGSGGLAEAWYFDPVYIWVNRAQTAAIVTP